MTGIILAGGQNIRMGSSKALLTLAGKPIIQRIIAVLQPLFREIIIVANDPARYGTFNYPVVGDIIPGKGPLSGLHAGLIASKDEKNFVVACDMPLLEAEIVRFMLSQVAGFDVVVPQIGPYLEPLHAVYAKNCLAAIEQAISAGERKVTSFFPQVRVNYLEERLLARYGDLDRAFLNINTPEDWLEVRQYLKKSGGIV